MQAYQKSPEDLKSKLKPDSKAKLKLVRDGDAEHGKAQLGGTAPAEDMFPGKHLVKCEAVWRERVGKGKAERVVYQYCVQDGKHHGVGLRQWMPYCDNGNIVTKKYRRHCEIALGRPLIDDDPYDNPEEIFVGRKFLVLVGYRKTERPRGGGKTSDELAMKKKDDSDYLKVHDIIERIDL